MVHTAVLKKEILQYLNPKENENFIDGTIGEAGHAILILEKNKPEGRVLGIDLDFEQIENSKLQTQHFAKRVILVNDSYVNLKDIVERINFKPVHGILLDLGYSSWQLEKSTRGFSFKKDEILDMRYDLPRQSRGSLIESGQNILTAKEIINEYSEKEIGKILEDYGQEGFARKIAKKIVQYRKIKKIESTFELKKIIEQIIPKQFQYGKIHCATKSFQALRIAVNRELDNLAMALPDAISVLSLGGRLVVISFHSLEDRIIKNFFKKKEKEKLIKILTPKPIVASHQEVMVNHRARSAKLRAVVKI